MNLAVARQLVAAIFLATAMADTALAQDSAQANNPLANTTALNFQNLYLGDLGGTGAHANQFYFRYAKPLQAFGSNWLMRATLPVNSFPVETAGSSETGIGDFNVFFAYLFDTGNPAISFGVGPQFTLPTATDDLLGTEKWSAGLANVLFVGTNPKFQFGYLLTWQASFAGSDDRADVNQGAFQPFAFYQLGDGWYLRSAGVWTYDFETDNFSIPIGLGIGKVTKTNRAMMNTFIEPQYVVDSRGAGQPMWNIFAGVNFQY